ncbi:MAG: PAS domain S-box protein, partial [Cyanobacteria bacterium]|nr:PAS domain S-box protein [Cyanobacteriota bacterium]
MKLLQQCMLFLSVLTIFQIVFLSIVFSNLVETDARLKEAQYSSDMAVKASAVMRGSGEYVVTTAIVQASSHFDNLIAREQLDELSRQVPAEFDALCALSKNHPEDHKDAMVAKENFDYVKKDIDAGIKNERGAYDLSYMINLRDQGRLGSIPRLMDITSSLTQIAKRHSDYAARLAQLEKERQDKFRLIMIGTIGLIILSSAIVMIGFSRRVTGRLAQIVDNFWRFERKEQLNPQQEGDDEIARVDQSFRALALQLENASEKEKAIFLYMPNGLIVCGENGLIEKLNPIAEDMLGGTSEELCGVSVSKFLTPLF